MRNEFDFDAWWGFMLPHALRVVLAKAVAEGVSGMDFRWYARDLARVFNEQGKRQ